MEIGYQDRDIGNIEAELATQLSEDVAVACSHVELTLFRSVLDALAMPMMMIGSSKRIAYANTAAKSFLSEQSFLTSHNGVISAIFTPAFAVALEKAAEMSIHRGAKDKQLCKFVPLIGRDHQRTAAYILPICCYNWRNDTNDDHCVVFIARRGQQNPILLEALRSMFDMTYSEARVAARIAQGDRPQFIAESLGVSVDTIRSHLKGAYLKSGSANKTALAALVKDFAPPV